jgi:hypothetical protein
MGQNGAAHDCSKCSQTELTSDNTADEELDQIEDPLVSADGEFCEEQG